MALDVIRVNTPREAAAILETERGARFVGGGTLVVRAVNYGSGEIDKLVLSDGLGLDQIAFEGNRATVGAAVTMARLAAEPRLSFLKTAAESIGGPAVRAMATIGGNLFAPYPYGDVAVALIALGAVATIQRLDAISTMPVEDFVQRRDGGDPGVVLSIGFALPPEGAFRFLKAIRRKPHGAAVVSIAAVLPVVGGKLKGVRIAYGAMAPMAIRATAVERALEGKLLDKAAIDAAIRVATEGCAPQSDPQASAWYRSAVLPVHLGRLLAGSESGEA